MHINTALIQNELREWISGDRSTAELSPESITELNRVFNGLRKSVHVEDVRRVLRMTARSKVVHAAVANAAQIYEVSGVRS